MPIPVLNLGTPTPKYHMRVSFAKSALRIVAGALLISEQFAFAGLAFAIAELLGVVEEVV